MDLIHSVNLDLFVNISQAHRWHHQTRTIIARHFLSVAWLRDLVLEQSRKYQSRWIQLFLSWMSSGKRTKFSGLQYLGSKTEIMMVPEWKCLWEEWKRRNYQVPQILALVLLSQMMVGYRWAPGTFRTIHIMGSLYQNKELYETKDLKSKVVLSYEFLLLPQGCPRVPTITDAPESLGSWGRRCPKAGGAWGRQEVHGEARRLVRTSPSHCEALWIGE